MELQNRSLTIDIFADTDQGWKDTIQAIHLYRACAREVYAIGMLAEIAAAKIEETEDGNIRVVPVSDRSKATLTALMEKEGKAHLYELRQHVLDTLWPSALSFVWDSLRRSVTQKWHSKDPEITKASRGFLTLNGARNLAQFNNEGIGFPQATGSPRLQDHGAILKWDREIGHVEYSFKRMDRGRRETWESILHNQWPAGTVYLNERKGKLRLSVSYARPGRSQDLIAEKTLLVQFLPDRIVMSSRNAEDAITMDHAKGALFRFAMRKQALEERRASCGSPTRSWGHRRGWAKDQEVLDRLTRQRSAYITDQNHAWTRRIASRAAIWRCAQVEVNLPVGGILFGLPWAWDQFRQFLEYKVGEIGGKTRMEGSPSNPGAPLTTPNGQVTISACGGPTDALPQ